MEFLCSGLILMMFSSSLFAQPTLHLGLVDPSTDSLLEFQSTDGSDVDIRFGYGWMSQQNFLLQCNYQFISTLAIGPGEIDYRIEQGDLATEYHFKNGGDTLPYLGMEVGWRRTKFGSVKESGFFLGSKAGIRFFLNNSVSIDTSISFRFSSDDVFIVDYQATDNTIYPGVGLKARF